MMTANKFLKMLAATPDELEKIVDAMSIDELRQFIKLFFKTINRGDLSF